MVQDLFCVPVERVVVFSRNGLLFRFVLSVRFLLFVGVPSLLCVFKISCITGITVMIFDRLIA